MKKNILLLLLSVGLLSGCTLDLGFIKLGGTSSESKENGKNNEKTPENPKENVLTTTIYTSGEEIANFATTVGVKAETDLLSGHDAAVRLENCLKAQVTNSKCITSAWFKNVNSASYGTSGSYAIIQLGSGQDNTGIFKWNSSAKIYKAVVNAYAFVNTDNVDEDAHLDVNGESFKLHEENDPAEKLTIVTKEFSSGTNELVLTSVDGRLFIESLTLTWKL